MKKVAVIMGSDSDFAVMSKAVTVLKGYGIPFEVHVYSTSYTDEAAEFSSKAKENGFGVIIAGAGMAAAIAGVLAQHTTLPVIGVPLVASGTRRNRCFVGNGEDAKRYSGCDSCN